MKNKKIFFKSLRSWLLENNENKPLPAKELIPDWYKKADRYEKSKITGEYFKATKEQCPFPKNGTNDDYGLIPTWKACPAILDSFMTGYILLTPCDIEFKKENNFINVFIKDKKYKSFCRRRNPMMQFEHPKGYYKEHFEWYPDWGVEVPEGYSCLYTTPINRFDLPFLNTTGIVDNDKLTVSGTIPFFIIKDWEGVIKKGTPYMQIIPFKRENWNHEIKMLNKNQIENELEENKFFYREPDGGVYKNKIWSKREYK